MVHYHAHVPEGALRIVLPTRDVELLRDVAEEEEVPVEQLAADLLVFALRSRAW